MRTISNYISEKLHLKADNKGNLGINPDPTEFIESFETMADKATMARLIGYCISAFKSSRNQLADDHQMFICKKENDQENRITTNTYVWDDNVEEKKYEVGDIQDPTSKDVIWKVIYVVTKKTFMPDKYKHLKDY